MLLYLSVSGIFYILDGRLPDEGRLWRLRLNVNTGKHWRVWRATRARCRGGRGRLDTTGSYVIAWKPLAFGGAASAEHVYRDGTDVLVRRVTITTRTPFWRAHRTLSQHRGHAAADVVRRFLPRPMRTHRVRAKHSWRLFSRRCARKRNVRLQLVNSFARPVKTKPSNERLSESSASNVLGLPFDNPRCKVSA